jgi:hypothetical protein
MRLILEKDIEEKIHVRGTLHLQVEVHHDDDCIIDAYNEIETTVENMKPITITVMGTDFRPILDILNVKITKLGSFGRAHFVAENIKIIDPDEVKRFLI